MWTWRTRRAGVVLAAILLPVSSSEAQFPSLLSPKAFELVGALGVSNAGSVVGGSAEGEQFYALGLAARYLHPSASRFQVGAELGGTRHSYQSFSVFGPSVDNESQTVLHFGPTARVMLGLNSHLDVGANVYQLPGGTDLGLSLGLGRRFSRSHDRYVPVGLQASVIMDADATLLVFVATVGYGWRR